jgi:hypothetical protein
MFPVSSRRMTRMAPFCSRFDAARLDHGAFQRKRQVAADKPRFGDRAFNP